eukprot:CAMPEP_0174729442 /NCGR_PEP_ID=MMETSP1094-20130205/53744_1 /TAXON_ID=156173 /ORGANISM="Chrysochromulina brevifilum, Strain UTEX LB 985" /LENGTH=98 /DNA_ID=CAMNT_0015931559 /DNA_START=745 /DNA_END=1041 /DNA_ORIENTATION=-
MRCWKALTFAPPRPTICRTWICLGSAIRTTTGSSIAMAASAARLAMVTALGQCSTCSVTLTVHSYIPCVARFTSPRKPAEDKTLAASAFAALRPAAPF